MSRCKEPPCGFDCSYKNQLPLPRRSLGPIGSSRNTNAHNIREHEHWLTREEMSDEIDQLLNTVGEQAKQIDQLRAENKRLHQQKFKARNTREKGTPTAKRDRETKAESEEKKRGAPYGHPPWNRKVPDRVDRIIEVDAPCNCPHCKAPTDLSRTDTTSFIQEDIVLRPQTIVSHYRHSTAYCPTCRRQVIRELDHELPFAPIGSNTKAAVLYLRHELKLPYRKIQHLMSTLFGLDFRPR